MLWLGILPASSLWAAQGRGLPPEWEVRKNISALATGVARIRPLLDQLKPQEWQTRGASEAYLTQWNTVRTEMDYLGRSLEILSAEPDRLTAVLDAFFRLERLTALLDSLGDGARRYQNPALADLLASVFAESGAQRELLRRYLLDLAEAKERQLQLLDEEAQRCRDMLIRRPPSRSSGSHSKTSPSAEVKP